MTAAPTHCFVVAAYGRSPHLKACLTSLSKQKSCSPVTISTSTPFEGMEALARDFGAKLSIHGPNRGIGADWNQALSVADADLVTIAHQDDLYEPAFAGEVTAVHTRVPDAVFSFCDSREIGVIDDQHVLTRNTRIRNLLVGASCLGTNRVAGGLRRRILFGFGNPVICPSVTINRRIASTFRFREDMRTNMDWLAWIELSRTHPVLRVRKELLRRRVHPASETSRCIADGTRQREDKLVFASLWPRPVANLISVAYRLSYPGYSK